MMKWENIRFIIGLILGGTVGTVVTRILTERGL